MSEKYGTEEMIRWFKSYCLFGSIRDAIIARLRAADKLCEAVSSLSEGHWGYANPHFVARLKKAIAEYERKEE